MVWIMNHTNQSVLMTILFHTSIILTGHFLPTQLAYQTGNTIALWFTGGLLLAIALVVFLYERPNWTVICEEMSEKWCLLGFNSRLEASYDSFLLDPSCLCCVGA
jgi:hypothetical protein